MDKPCGLSWSSYKASQSPAGLSLGKLDSLGISSFCGGLAAQECSGTDIRPSVHSTSTLGHAPTKRDTRFGRKRWNLPRMGAEEHYVQSWALKEMKCISLVFILFLCFVDILQILAKKKKKQTLNHLWNMVFLFCSFENLWRQISNVFDKLRNIFSWYLCRNWLNCIITACSTVNCNHM